MDIALIRQRLGSAAATVTPTLTTYTYTPDSVSEPCWYPAEVELAYASDGRLTFNGEPIVEVVCYLLVSRASDRQGQIDLDGYLASTGAGSVRTAVESDRTLGGACKTLQVHHVDGYRLYTVGDKTYYGARFRVIVIGG